MSAPLAEALHIDSRSRSMRPATSLRDLPQDFVGKALRFAIELADQAQMARHLVEGPHRVARRDGLVDGRVIADGRRSASGMWIVVVRWSISQPTKRVMHADEDRIAGDRGQFVVERDVGADEDGRVAERRRVGIEGRLEPGDVLVGGDACRLPSDARLEQQPRLLHVFMALPGGRQAADEAGELAGQELPGGGRDAGPRAARDLDQTLLLQDEQRLPDGGAADAEALRQLLLGGHRSRLP